MVPKSVADLHLRFTTYIGDGDSNAYPAAVASNPYGTEKPVDKGECVGHVQNQVGGRLRKLKKANGRKLLEDKKTLGGARRLNEKVINKLQNYYGLAIRQNTDSLPKIMGSIIRDAIVMHMKTNNLFANEQHGFVPNKNCVTQLIESLHGVK